MEELLGKTNKEENQKGNEGDVENKYILPEEARKARLQKDDDDENKYILPEEIRKAKLHQLTLEMLSEMTELDIVTRTLLMIIFILILAIITLGIVRCISRAIRGIKMKN